MHVAQLMTLGQAADLYHRRQKVFQGWVACRCHPRYKSSPEEEDRYRKASQSMKELADYLWENGVNVYN